MTSIAWHPLGDIHGVPWIPWFALLFFSFSPTSCYWLPSSCTCRPCSGVLQPLHTFAQIWSSSWRNLTKFTTAQLKPQGAYMAYVTPTWEMVPAQFQVQMRTQGKGNLTPSRYPVRFCTTHPLSLSCPSGLAISIASRWGIGGRCLPGDTRWEPGRPALPKSHPCLYTPAPVLTSRVLPLLSETSLSHVLKCTSDRGNRLRC